MNTDAFMCSDLKAVHPPSSRPDLEGDLAVVAEVLGQEHDGHPALAQLEVVAAGEAGRELVLEGGHGEGKDACDCRRVPDWAGASRATIATPRRARRSNRCARWGRLVRIDTPYSSAVGPRLDEEDQGDRIA
jgi:hypothetical protein